MTDFEPQLEQKPLPKIPLPQRWSELVLMALLHVTTLARLAIMNARNWPDGLECDGLRLRADNDRLKCEVALIERELTIKDARFSRLPAKKRPEYLPSERLEILLIKTMRGLNNSQLARRFQITVQTVRRWLRGVCLGNKIVELPEKATAIHDIPASRNILRFKRLVNPTQIHIILHIRPCTNTTAQCLSPFTLMNFP